jgi:hypothetical protein
MDTHHYAPWPPIDVAELRFALAFGSSVEDLADFLVRDVEDVRHQVELEAQKAGPQVLDEVDGLPGVYEAVRDRPRS